MSTDTNRSSARATRATLRAFARAALLIQLSLAAAAHAQQQQQPRAPQQPDDVVKIETALIQAGVTVLDKQGRFVEGLKPEQFEVLVDGRAQPLSFFEHVAAGSADERAKLAAAGDARAALRTTSAQPQPLGRTVIFFLDDLHMPAESLLRARKLIQFFVDREMGEEDSAAVASASGQLGFLQQLTSNRDVLRAAVSRLKPQAQSRGDDQLPVMSEYTAKAIDVDFDRDVFETYVQAVIRDNLGMRRQMAESMVRTRARTILQVANANTRNTLRSLNTLVRAVAPMPGRKLAFFLSDGFLLSRNDTDVSDAMRDITDAAVRAGVVLYTLDTRGLATEHWLDAGAGAPPADLTGALARSDVGSMTASQEALYFLAEQTGGRAILNTNAQTAALNRTVNETAAYYLLAWRPSDGDQHAGKFRHLEVSVKNRPDLVVLVQRGFVEGASDASARRRAGGGQSKQAAKPGEELNAALSAAVPVRELPANLEVGYVVTDKGDAIVTTLVSVPVDSLSLDQAGKASVEVAGYVVNLDGKIGSRFGERLSMTPTQATPGPGGRGYVLYRHDIKVAPGLYQVRAAARDAAGARAGSAAEWIEVPDLKTAKLTLGTVVVGERPADTGQPLNAENFLTQRSAERRFARGSALRFMTYIYNAARGPAGAPDLEATVQVIRDGKPVLSYYKLKVEPGAPDARAIAYGVEVPLDTLAPGRYVLQLTVADNAAKLNASGRTLFTVE